MRCLWPHSWRCFFRVMCALLACALASSAGAQNESAWKRHTIDNTSQGADGARSADVNGDGLLDLVVGWEEGKAVRVYVNPGREKSKSPWPLVTVGEVGSPEDAVLVDLDGDGSLDVVSSCEGRERSVFVHWGPKDKSKLLDAKAWQTQPFPQLKDKGMWMFCLPMQIDGKHGPELVLGAKGNGAPLGWLESPADARHLQDWRWHALGEVGWIMSIDGSDVDGDGDLDVVVSDRKGTKQGCFWLEKPAGAKAMMEPWVSRRIGPGQCSPMFQDLADVDGDGRQDILVAGLERRIFLHRRTDEKTPDWLTSEIEFPARPGTGKAVRVGDIDLDGKADVILTLGEGQPNRGGVVWMSGGKNWAVSDISGPAPATGYKPDRIELIDLDGDGDLDVITTEERSGYGVIWYENPAK